MKTSLLSSLKSRSAFLYGTLLLDAVLLGGIATLWLVQKLLVQISERLVSVEAQSEILNVLDHLLPFFAYYGAIALVLTGLTSLAIGIRTRSWRLAALPVAVLAALALVPLLPF